MSTTIKHKRSSTQGSVPQTSDIVYGEIALNTYDGRLYFKKNTGTGDVIVTLQEVTEENISMDSSGLSNSTSNNLKNVINDLDDAITSVAATSGGSVDITDNDDLIALILAL
jgi:hypothetical protein